MNKARILIVEDEFIIAENLRRLLTELGYGVVGHAFDADGAHKLLAEHHVDLVMLDIKLAGSRDGVIWATEVRKKSNVAIIFLTSNSDAATVKRATEVSPEGFLVKPFSRDEIFATIEIALAKMRKEASQAHLFLKVGTTMRKIMLQEITFLKADRVYVELHRKDNLPIVVRESLNAWEEKLPGNFLRIHRSCIVNINQIDAIDTGSIVVGGVELPISKTGRADLLERLSFES
jgi:two-component system, LytTR family, response regulator LytT